MTVSVGGDPWATVAAVASAIATVFIAGLTLQQAALARRTLALLEADNLRSTAGIAITADDYHYFRRTEDRARIYRVRTTLTNLAQTANSVTALTLRVRYTPVGSGSFSLALGGISPAENGLALPTYLQSHQSVSGWIEFEELIERPSLSGLPAYELSAHPSVGAEASMELGLMMDRSRVEPSR